MEEKKNVFISYLDDDDEKKFVWIDKILTETSSYITFIYNDDLITIPFHRILKIKKKEVEDDI